MPDNKTLPFVGTIIAKHPLFAAILLLLVGVIVGAVVRGSIIGGSGEPLAEPMAGMVPTHGGNVPQQASLWTCAMHPQIRQPNPGSCPICGMDLVPVAATSGGLRTLTISPASRALMNVASTPVERRYVSHEVPLVGKVDYDETKLAYITAWMPGRLDRLYVDYTGVEVNQGDHMVYIYSPELYSAQGELIQGLRRNQLDRSDTTRFTPAIDYAESARVKLRLLGLTEAQISEIEKQDRPTDHLTIYAPLSGVVIEKLKQEGDYVRTGERIYTVADLNQVWVHLDAYETDLPWIRYGQDVTITAEALPGEEFHGRISFIQRVLSDETRTVKVRVNVPNPDGKLKPEMFVHAVVRPEIAAGGRVMDPALAGKWICPMHPEIVKEHIGTCDICGMALVTAESLGYVTPDANAEPPLVIPYTAALVTGRRAIVYVELPVMPSKLETAFQGVAAAVETGNLEQVRQAFANSSSVLDEPYDQPGTEHARRLWNDFANRLAPHALTGQRVQSQEEAAAVFSAVQTIMSELREQFGPVGQPTFEGREIVLGPRAGDYYLVKHGLAEGELVVTQGNFKIDAEIQIQAKPSMMTPEGGGGGGHQHGGHAGGEMKAGSDAHAGHSMALPAPFQKQIRNVETVYEQITEAIQQEDLGKTTANYVQLGQAIKAVDRSLLTGNMRMQWNELAMLLGNDAVEGSEVEQMSEADRVYLLLKGHMRRLREQLPVAPDEQHRHVEQIAVSPRFQAELAAIWEQYLAVHAELANDRFKDGRIALADLESAVVTVDDASLSANAKERWGNEEASLTQLIDNLRRAGDIEAMRAEFKPLSETIGTLVRAFGFGEASPVYELHCPMAFGGKGAVWYQDNDQVRNPYFGTSMPTCADRVEEVRGER